MLLSGMFCISTSRGFSPVNHFTLVLVQVAWTFTIKIDVSCGMAYHGICLQHLASCGRCSQACWSDQPWSTYRINIKWNWKNMTDLVTINAWMVIPPVSSLYHVTDYIYVQTIYLIILIFVAAHRNHVGICTMLWAQRCGAGGCRREATWIEVLQFFRWYTHTYVSNDSVSSEALLLPAHPARFFEICPFPSLGYAGVGFRWFWDRECPLTSQAHDTRHFCI